MADEADHEGRCLLVVEPGKHGDVLKLQRRVVTVKVIVDPSLRCRLRQDQARLDEALKYLRNVRSKPGRRVEVVSGRLYMFQVIVTGRTMALHRAMM